MSSISSEVANLTVKSVFSGFLVSTLLGGETVNTATPVDDFSVCFAYEIPISTGFDVATNSFLLM